MPRPPWKKKKRMIMPRSLSFLLALGAGRRGGGEERGAETWTTSSTIQVAVACNLDP